MPNKKEELIFSELNHQYRLMPSGQIIPSTTQIIESVFPFQGQGLAAERARDFGSAVHKAIALDIKGTLNLGSVDSAIKPYFYQWRDYYDNFLRNEYFPPVQDNEIALYSPTYFYAGTIDVVTHYKIIEIKSGQPNPTHRLQLSSYKHLWQINNKQKMKKGIIIYLDGTDDKPKIVEEQPQDFHVFLSCLDTHNFKQLEGIK